MVASLVLEDQLVAVRSCTAAVSTKFQIYWQGYKVRAASTTPWKEVTAKNQLERILCVEWGPLALDHE